MDAHYDVDSYSLSPLGTFGQRLSRFHPSVSASLSFPPSPAMNMAYRRSVAGKLKVTLLVSRHS